MAPVRFAERGLDHIVHVERRQLAAMAPDPGERQEILDQLLHADSAVDRERDELGGVTVELSP